VKISSKSFLTTTVVRFEKTPSFQSTQDIPSLKGFRGCNDTKLNVVCLSGLELASSRQAEILLRSKF
jgi:hypothetical protein